MLTGAVVLAHLVVLQNAPLSLEASDPFSTKVFTTRTLHIAPRPAAEAPPSPAAAAAPARKVDRTPSKANASAPEQVLAGLRSIAPPAAAVVPEPVVAQADPPAPAASAPGATMTPPSLPVPAPQAVPTAAAAAAPAQETAPVPPAQSKDAALPARNYAVPGSVRLKFNATAVRGRLNYEALGELLWQHDGEAYQVRLEAGAWGVGSRVSTSLGRITSDGLAPKTYTDGPKGKAPLAAHFERDRSLVVFSANTPDVPLKPGAQDRLSIFVQLASMVAGEPAKFPPGTRIETQTVTPRAAENWTFTVEKEEKLYLPGGHQESLYLVSAPRREFDQKVEVWLAPALSYLPARIRVTDANGSILDLQWRTTAAP